jgi:hypothetical protein
VGPHLTHGCVHAVITIVPGCVLAVTVFVRERVWENFSSHCIHAVVAMVRAKYGGYRALAFIAHFVQAVIALEHAQDVI